ncbi:hypothetical protein [Endozoicomonas sp. SESOKO1]|uniref:hypothetical protein n=1 Tax=Endozoicomonas sp. SESOKO1 TaxID=2828742 RepID=UPI0021495C61|nr:hypothetical protein [Endozoicomonas sp. SESOKO1]
MSSRVENTCAPGNSRPLLKALNIPKHHSRLKKLHPDLVDQKLGGFFDAIINRAVAGVVPYDSS